MTFDSGRPYNDLPTLPPNVELESRQVLKACIPARSALAELKQAAQLLPNQTILINSLPLLEAKDSSEIENILTTTDQLFQYAQEDTQADPATREALRYRTALYQGYLALDQRPLCSATAVTICSTIKGREMAIRKVPGTTIAKTVTGEIIYAKRGQIYFQKGDRFIFTPQQKGNRFIFTPQHKWNILYPKCSE